MNKSSRFEHYYVLQGRYAFGWEDLCAGDNKECRDALRDYRTNEGGNYRIIHRKEKSL